MNFKPLLEKVRETGDFSVLAQQIPYAATIGVEIVRLGDELVFRLPARESNLGNPILPAIHGGVIGGFMELSAALYLMLSQDCPHLPRIVDYSIDYLRAGLHRDTFCECRITRQGNRVANVMVTAWQKSRQEPIATVRAHFLMDG
ncbi:MAG: PaaI family thioesterase [Gammaproteobacteria bacterium]|nr:PaaI family thioesterase [Gammaproteobacteria bacterium]